MKKNIVVLVFIVIIILCGFKNPNKEKYLLSVEMNGFELSVIGNLQSDKLIKVKFMPSCDLFVPVVNNKQIFYVTQLKDKNNRKNKKSNLIIHLDWNFDSTIVVDKMKFRHLKNSTDYVEIIDLSNYKDIESITFSICYFKKYTTFANILKRDFIIPSKFYRFYVTAYFDKEKEYIPLLIKSI